MRDMSKLKDSQVHDVTAAQAAVTEEQAAVLQGMRSELADAFTQFDGTTLGYVRYLSGVSDERLRQLGAI